MAPAPAPVHPEAVVRRNGGQEEGEDIEILLLDHQRV